MNANETNDSCFRGDVEATLNFGFESIKLDGCGDQKNVTHYAKLVRIISHIFLNSLTHSRRNYSSTNRVFLS